MIFSKHFLVWNTAFFLPIGMDCNSPPHLTLPHLTSSHPYTKMLVIKELKDMDFLT